MKKTNFNPLINYGIHTTHNDADAVGCAVALNMIDRQIDYTNDTYFCPVGEQDKILNEVLDNLENNQLINYIKSIVISDLSLKVETCKRLMDLAYNYDIRLLGVDHHETNNLGKMYEWWYVDNKFTEHTSNEREVSAAYLLFIKLMTMIGKERYWETTRYYKLFKVIKIISDYDTWEWKSHPVNQKDKIKEDIVAIVCNEIGPEDMYLKLLKFLNEDFSSGQLFPNLFYDIYKLNTVKRDKYLKTLETTARVFRKGKYYYAMLISENDFNNAGAEYLYNLSYVDVVIVLYPSTCRIGLRTNLNDVNVAEIAKKYGGEGHQKASGFKLSDEEFLDAMKVFYLEALPYHVHLNNEITRTLDINKKKKE